MTLSFDDQTISNFHSSEDSQFVQQLTKQGESPLGRLKGAIEQRPDSYHACWSSILKAHATLQGRFRFVLKTTRNFDDQSFSTVGTPFQ